MSTAVDGSLGPMTEAPGAAGRGSLFRAEVHRLRSRRFLHVLLALAFVGWLGATALALNHYGVPTASDRAVAQQTMRDVVAQNEVGRQQCLDDPSRPSGTPDDEVCGPRLTLDQLNENDFLPHQPFDFARTGTAGALGFGAASAVLAFLIGATWIGAEWSTRSLVALLFWVPRRTTVMGTKLGVLALAATLLGILAQAGWLATAGILRAVDSAGGRLPSGFWGHLLATEGRAVLLTVFAALLGFGLTNLIRNTGAALGIAFVYFAVLETLIRVVRPSWQPWLLSENAIGLVSPGGTTVYLFDGLGPGGFDQPRQIVISNLQAGVVLGLITAVIVGAGACLFNRRDLH